VLQQYGGDPTHAGKSYVDRISHCCPLRIGCTSLEAATFATAAPMRMTPVMDHLTIVGKMAPELAARKEPVYVYRRW
jgi:hypothetical protein